MRILVLFHRMALPKHQRCSAWVDELNLEALMNGALETRVE